MTLDECLSSSQRMTKKLGPWIVAFGVGWMNRITWHRSLDIIIERGWMWHQNLFRSFSPALLNLHIERGSMWARARVRFSMKGTVMCVRRWWGRWSSKSWRDGGGRVVSEWMVTQMQCTVQVISMKVKVTRQGRLLETLLIRTYDIIDVDVNEAQWGVKFDACYETTIGKYRERKKLIEI